AFFNLAKETGIRLIVDETYRDFDSRPAPPHGLLGHKDWDRTLVQLYSFSKAYRLTGHRVGAAITNPLLLAEMEKFLDTVAICPTQLGQKAALWGLRNLSDWVAAEREEILDRRAAIQENMPKLTARGWRLMGLGAYFAYLQHPFAESSANLAPRLVQDAGILALPGTMFMPADAPDGASQFRIAFANVDREGIAALFDRLAALSWPLAEQGADA
ncbi:MAG: aminotransferase class I/II-fold pyridoxal phosphate-dependent enzyme, partial [Rhodobacteraceae bacterium]|nr:aminotransferase class I/II-fold pyridoxal phosphate-dependent enzyme [Paracoccaceae bacterium]